MKKIISMIMFLLLFAVLSCGRKNIRKDITVCSTKNEIAANNGKVVILKGVFKTADMGKTWVTFIVLPDGTYTVYQYSRVDSLEGKKAEVTGTVYISGYPSKYLYQKLLAPHIRDVTSVKILN